MTGLIAALGAGHRLRESWYEAAWAGAWLAGRAAEFVLAVGDHSEESLLASDTADALGLAFRELRSGF